MPSKRQPSKQRRAADNRHTRAQRAARALNAGELAASAASRPSIQGSSGGTEPSGGGTAKLTGRLSTLFGGGRRTSSATVTDPTDTSVGDGETDEKEHDDGSPSEELANQTGPATAEDTPRRPSRPPRAEAQPVSGGRGLIATWPDGTRLPGAMATFIGVALAGLAVVLLLSTPLMEVDDRGEAVPTGAPEDEFKGLYLEARGYLVTGDLGEPIEVESRTLVQQQGAAAVLLIALPFLMVLFAWYMHRKTGLSRPLTFGMLAVAVAVFFLSGVGGQFYIPALIALAVGSFQARKAELPARMAERMTAEDDRAAARETGDDDGIIDVESSEVYDDDALPLEESGDDLIIDAEPDDDDGDDDHGGRGRRRR